MYAKCSKGSIWLALEKTQSVTKNTYRSLSSTFKKFIPSVAVKCTRQNTISLVSAFSLHLLWLDVKVLLDNHNSVQNICSGFWLPGKVQIYKIASYSDMSVSLANCKIFLLINRILKCQYAIFFLNYQSKLYFSGKLYCNIRKRLASWNNHTY